MCFAKDCTSAQLYEDACDDHLDQHTSESHDTAGPKRANIHDDTDTASGSHQRDCECRNSRVYARPGLDQHGYSHDDDSAVEPDTESDGCDRRSDQTGHWSVVSRAS